MAMLMFKACVWTGVGIATLIVGYDRFNRHFLNNEESALNRQADVGPVEVRKTFREALVYTDDNTNITTRDQGTQIKRPMLVRIAQRFRRRRNASQANRVEIAPMPVATIFYPHFIERGVSTHDSRGTQVSEKNFPVPPSSRPPWR